MKALILAALTAAMVAPGIAVSQSIAEANAVSGGLDTLNSQPTGGGGGFFATERARGAVDAANSSPAFGGAPSQPGPFGQQNPFGTDGGFPGGQPGFGASGAPTPIPIRATLRAWAGEQIYDHYGNKELLQDARQLSVFADEAGNVFDDGTNGNDAVAGDGIYTNITRRSDFISPEAHIIKSKLIDTLRFVSPPQADSLTLGQLNAAVSRDLQGIGGSAYAELRQYLLQPRKSESMEVPSNLTAMQFAGVRVATTEPNSPLPSLMKLEREQDRKLLEWGYRFLRDFRIDPDKFDSEFYPTYLPWPPPAPRIPMPASFTTKAGGSGGPGVAGGPGVSNQLVTRDDPFNDPVTGEPIGNASSRYF